MTEADKSTSPLSEKETRPRPSLAEVLANEEWLKSLDEYGKKHLCNEHLDFYCAVDHFKSLPDSERREEASRIVLKFLLDDAQDLVSSVEDRTRERLTKTLLETTGVPPRDFFDSAQEQAHVCLDHDILTRWWIDFNAPPPPPPPKKLTPLKLIVLCDEKKTAMDTGSFFVNANYTTALNADVLTKEMIEQLDVDVLVVDMGTRETSASNAVATIDSYRDIGVANLPKPCAIVKRIDIMLSGNIVAELSATLNLFGRNVVLFAPASPDRGYITIEGHQYKDGNKIERSNIAALFEGSDFAIERITLDDIEKGEVHLLDIFQEIVFREKKTVIISDAKTSDQLAKVIQVAAKIGVVDRPIICGSKGMLGHLPKAFGFEKAQ